MTDFASPLINIDQDERLAVAFSGGGDSTALVHMLRGQNPMPLVLIVDHALRAKSAIEANKAKAFAQNLGLETRILTWKNSSPRTGLQEKARLARYALLGQACREAGIAHLVTGHTQDDQAETVLMRFDRGTGWRGAAGMRPLSYAPLWPQLAGVTLHRPLLGMSRSQLRDYNTRNNLTWTDDPSNENRNFTRIKARDKLAQSPALKVGMLHCASDLQTGRSHENARFADILKRHVEISPDGIIHLKSTVPVALLSTLLRAASGTGGPIAKDKLQGLKAAIQNSSFKGATLGGAQIIPAPQGVFIGPDPALALGRRGQPDIALQGWPNGHTRLWAGRFWITAQSEGLTVKPLEGHISNLPRPLYEHVRTVPAAFRRSLPFVTDSRGEPIAVGSLSKDRRVTISSAVAPRLQGLFAPL